MDKGHKLQRMFRKLMQKLDGRRRESNRVPEPADGARIVYRAVRTPFYRKPRIMIPIAVVSVFVIGIGMGTTLGLMLSPSSEPPSTEVALSEHVTPQGASDTIPSGVPLPVAAYGSERAREAYQGALDEIVTQPSEPVEPAASPPVPTEIHSSDDDPAPPPENSAQDAEERSLTQDVLAALNPPDSLPVDTWRRFAARSVPPDGGPRIAIVIDDLGIDQERSFRAVELPAPLTLAIIPYGLNLPELARAGRERGHEILVHMPMAPLGLGIDPGPNALHRELGAQEIARRIQWNLSQFDGYVGVNNHMGSRFTADRESMALVIAEIRRRGLLYLDSVTTPETQGFRLAAQAGVFHAVRDVFLDNIQDAAAIRQQLDRAERIAREQGHAIVIGHPHDETLSVLTDWISQARTRGFQLVPLSALVSQNPTASES